VEFNENMVLPILVTAVIVGLLAYNSFLKTRNLNEGMNIMQVRTRGAYGTGQSRKPWFGTPFFLIFCAALVIAWVIWA
jgi:hypothetical protein